MADGAAYRPIACALHDRLEAAATLGRPVSIVYRDAEGAPHAVEDRIVDVFARGGEEHARTATGLVIRLDRLESVDGVAFAPHGC